MAELDDPEVEVELDEEDELELLEPGLLELPEELVVVVELVVDVDDVVELVETQFSVSLASTPETGGRLSCEIGVPGATLGTVKV